MYEQLIIHLQQHASFTQAELHRICSFFKRKVVKRNEILLEPGNVCRYMQFINNGCLRVFVPKLNGTKSTRFFIMENRFGTALPSFINQKTSTAGIESIEPSELLQINYPDYQRLLNTIPAMEHTYRLGLERDYIESIQRIESLITLDAHDRYEQIVAQNPAIIMRIPSKIVAEFLGISQETLSRLKSKK